MAKRKITYLVLVLLLAVVFGITGFNFDDPSFEENSKEYLLLVIALIIGAIYLISGFSRK